MGKSILKLLEKNNKAVCWSAKTNDPKDEPNSGKQVFNFVVPNRQWEIGQQSAHTSVSPKECKL